MSWVNVENCLKAAMGLDAASVGTSAIEHAVAGRLRACRLHDIRDYWKLLSTSSAELQELIEAVVVSETWFFRDAEAFAAMVRLIREEWPGFHSGAAARLLSLPCSTGEEPYSMAMALLDGGVQPDRFRIDGIDISERAVALARRGVYRNNSFRGQDLAFRDRHFLPEADGFRICDKVRAPVNLYQGNLFAENFLSGKDQYLVIFCRNVLIYFDRPTQDRAMSILDRLLAKNGWLFVAPSETGLLGSHGYTPVKIPRAFAFRRAEAAPASPGPKLEAPAPAVRFRPPTRTPTPVPAVARKSTPTAAQKPVVAETHADADADIAKAERLADQGHLVEAAKLCEAWLGKNAPSARAFQLMGLVREASGSLEEATQYFRKALYLDPSHHEVLVHLAYLLNKQGDTQGAKLLHERAQRATPAGRS